MSKKLRRWDWGPRLDEAKADAPDAPGPPRARKDRRRWCRGKPGVEHKPVYRISKHAMYMRAAFPRTRTSCGWIERRKWEWHMGERVWEPTGTWGYECQHERACTECGKILNHYLPAKECPDWKPR